MTTSHLPLYVGIQRVGLPANAHPQPLARAAVCRCAYCGISASGSNQITEPVFYTWTQRGQTIEACVVCTSALNINTIGLGRGLVIFMPEVPQRLLSQLAHVILAAYASEGELAAMTDDQRSETSDVMQSALQTLSDIKGVGVMQLGEFVSDPANALPTFADALGQAEDYVAAINNTAPYLRYWIDLSDANARVGAFFKNRFFVPQGLGVSRWAELVKNAAEPAME